MPKKPRKIRVEFRKNRQVRRREGDWTRRFQQDDRGLETAAMRESVRPKGELSRRRTIIVDESGCPAPTDGMAGPQAGWRAGRVLCVTGNLAMVEAVDGRVLHCAVSRVLRTIAIEGRSSVTAGDYVQIRPTEAAASGKIGGEPQGMIERVEPRRGVLTRAYRGREQVIAANVDQVLIACALAEPGLKPNLVDRTIVAAEKAGIRSVLCLNKADLVDIAGVQPYVGLYCQLGYEVVIASARTGIGLGRLRQVLRDRTTVVAGQSGVGKSSLLNAVDPALALEIGEISQSTLHGKHTTRVARLHKLSVGGWVIDTPGIRQFELWDVIPEELEGHFIEFRPYVSHCRFPNCTHTHENGCAVKDAVDGSEIDPGRYERYLNLFRGDRAVVSE